MNEETPYKLSISMYHSWNITASGCITDKTLYVEASEINTKN